MFRQPCWWDIIAVPFYIPRRHCRTVSSLLWAVVAAVIVQGNPLGLGSTSLHFDWSWIFVRILICYKEKSLWGEVRAIHEIENEFYALAMLKHAWAARIWQFCWTCPYWVSWSNLMRTTDQVSSPRGHQISLQMNWTQDFWKSRQYS